MAEFIELLKKRRSIRHFENKEVPLKIIRDIIKESCLAPSAANGQPWRFIIINNKDVIKRLSDDAKKNLISYIEKNPVLRPKNTRRLCETRTSMCFITLLVSSILSDRSRSATCMWIARLQPVISCFPPQKEDWEPVGSVWGRVYKILIC